jgi:hypothetical protein
MNRCIGLLAVSVVCAAQQISPSFDEQHATGVEQNPSGVTLTISTRDGRSAYHLSDTLNFRLSFISNNSHMYTLELDGAMNIAGVSDDLVIERPEAALPIHSQPSLMGYICCHTDRRYLGNKPLVADTTLRMEYLERSLNFRLRDSQFLGAIPPFAEKLKPGEYSIFIRSRRLMRGWPKSLHDQYHTVSDIVVTSINVLHITILPDFPEGNGGKH